MRNHTLESGFDEEGETVPQMFIGSHAPGCPIQTIGDRVAVLLGKRPAEIAGILLPESAKPKADRGRVAAVGPLCRLVKVGDMVVLPKTLGEDHDIAGRRYAILREDEIPGVVEGAAVSPSLSL